MRLPSSSKGDQAVFEKRSKMGKNNKAKGAANEREIARAIATAVELGISDVERTRGGKGKCDIKMSAEAKRRWPFHVECKSGAIHLPQWIRQADADAAATGETPVIVFKQKGSNRRHVCLDFDVFMQLVTMAHAPKED